MDDRDFVYVCADGVHFNVRLQEDRLCALVIVGARADGTTELVARQQQPCRHGRVSLNSYRP